MSLLGPRCSNFDTHFSLLSSPCYIQMVAAFSSDSCLSWSTYLNALTVLEILHELRDKLDIPHSCWGRKSLLIDYILTNAPEPIATELEKLGWCKVFDLQVREKRKRKFESSHGWRRNVHRWLNDGDCGNDEQNFLVLPSEDAVCSCSHKFYMSTNQAAFVENYSVVTKEKLQY